MQVIKQVNIQLSREKIRVCFKNIYYNHTATVEQEHNEFLHVSHTSAARAQALALALASAAEAADDFAWLFLLQLQQLMMLELTVHVAPVVKRRGEGRRHETCRAVRNMPGHLMTSFAAFCCGRSADAMWLQCLHGLLANFRKILKTL